MEYIIGAAILIVAIKILSKNIKNKAKGKCECDYCPSNCKGCESKDNKE